MKKLKVLLVLYLSYNLAFAQISLNLTGNPPDPSAAWDIQFTDKGILIPRMTQAQRNAISTPATSLLIYQTDNTPGYYYWNGSQWVMLGLANHTHSNLTNGTGISPFTYNGSASATVGVVFGTTAGTVAEGNHTHANLTNGTGISPFTYNGSSVATISLANTGVAPGSYNNANITVNAQGQITSASSGSGGGITMGCATNNYVLKRQDATTASCSQIFDNGTNVGIGTTSPTTSALLDISSTNRGVIFPRVALTSATNQSPITGTIADGVIVYNTATAGSGLAAVTPGYFYWQNNRWNKLQTSGYAGAVFGVYPGTPNHLSTLAPSWQCMHAYIDIPPGKWIIFGFFLISPNKPGNINDWDYAEYISLNPPYTAAVWVRTTLSNSNASFSVSPYIIGSPLVSGSLVYPIGFAMTSGAWYVNNTTSSTQRLYLWANINRYNTQCGVHNFVTTMWGENQFFAIPAE